MTRSNARETAMHLVYAMDCTGESPEEVLCIRMAQEYYDRLAEENDVYADRPSRKQYLYIQSILDGIAREKAALDETISRYAIGWSLKRISRLAQAILRLAIYECLYVDDVPTGVAISEAVELAKKYETEEIVSFVNGILGSFSREMGGRIEEAAPAEASAAAEPSDDGETDSGEEA